MERGGRDGRRDRLREEILAAAGEMFAREGYEQISMRRIAAKIGYTAAALYHYFPDKSALLREICEATFAGLVERIESVTASAADPVEALLTGCRAYIEFGLENPHAYIVTFVRPPERTVSEIPFEDSAGERAFRCLSGALGACVSTGREPAVDVHLASCCWWASMHGLTSLLIAHPCFPWPERERMIDELLARLWTGLQAGPVTAPRLEASLEGEKEL
jgi:AcrR family transcriptional regulator